MKGNFEVLEALVASLGISQKELENWVKTREGKNELIPTELPLVYRQGKELTVEKGLNLSRKSYLWGVQLPSGVMIALKSGSHRDWYDAFGYARYLEYDGQNGSLPLGEALFKYDREKDFLEEDLYYKTKGLLENYGIEVDHYSGRFWCKDKDANWRAYYFDLDTQSLREAEVNEKVSTRVAVAF